MSNTKVVILTGASQGIGRATAYKFIQAGYKVALVARSTKLLTEIVNDVGEEKALAIPADISHPESASIIIEKTINHFGNLDILINNAAVGIYGPTATVSITEMQSVMNVNFFGAVQLMQACILAMKKNGGGLIINISSIIGKRATPWSGGYCASKAALERIVESMRVELAPDNIRFSTLYPGVTQTNFLDNALGSDYQGKGRMKGVSAEKVALKLLKMAKKEPRDAYVTLFDRVFVGGSMVFPGLFDWLFERYF